MWFKPRAPRRRQCQGAPFGPRRKTRGPAYCPGAPRPNCRVWKRQAVRRQAVATAGSGNGRQLVAAADGVQSDCRRRQGDAAPAQGESGWWGRSGLGDAGVCKQRRRCEEEAGRHSSACRTPPPQTPQDQSDTLPAIMFIYEMLLSAVRRCLVRSFCRLNAVNIITFNSVQSLRFTATCRPHGGEQRREIAGDVRGVGCGGTLGGELGQGV